MDTINPVSGTSQPYSVPASKGSSSDATSVTQQPKAAAVTLPEAVTPTDTGSSSDATDQQYEAALRQAALSFKNTYAISDQQFSIFKDASGKYITRYVSLRDGKVTYVPEITLVKQIQMSSGSSAARVAISA